jgi:hydrolase, P-loop family
MSKVFTFKENEPLTSLVKYILSRIDSIEAILLNGELGAGKTTLVKQIAAAIGEKEKIISPTFNNILIHDKLVHIDAYKLRGNLFPYEDYFENKLVIIEWAKNITHSFKNILIINVYLKNNKHVFEVEN